MSRLLELSKLPGFAGKIFFGFRAFKNKIGIHVKGSDNLLDIRSTPMNSVHFDILGNNNRVVPGNSILLKSSVKISGDDNQVLIESGALLESCTIRLMGNGHKIIIGKNCRLRNVSFWLEDRKDTIRIGADTTIEGAHLAVTEPDGFIHIGEDCMFSYGIDVRNGDSHVILDSDTGERINYPADIHIGNHVWLGAHVQILKGVRIEDGAVIGIRSLVAGNIPAASLAAGVPARVIRNNIRWERDRSTWFKKS